MNKIYLLIIFTLIVITFIILGDLQFQKDIKPYRRRTYSYKERNSKCSCYRQSNNGTRGFCAQCVNGTLFGCPNGCHNKCHKKRFSIDASPQCIK